MQKDMGNDFNPEFIGEKLRALVEFVVPSRQNVVGGAVLNMEKSVSDFDLKYSPISSNPTRSTAEKIKLATKTPERAITPQPVSKVNQTRQPSLDTQNSQEVNLTVSTARANLSAIYSSIVTGEQK